ncbi:glucokinase [Oceaniglobus roseus]|uniref:glucokinase n=1 Tax=Oceaniglobus roseus TaxID=1737570 RepID=UPI000C7F1FA8|nr:glucokinase [Kandeliimicrobium roseum]
MSDSPADPLSIVADIGGTNTRVALARRDVVDTASIERFRNAEHRGLEEVLRAYLSHRGNPAVAAACVAVAGPVHDGHAAMTNLDWRMDKTTLEHATGATTVALLNDLQAQGHALDHIDPDNLRLIVEGPEPGPHAAKLVIGVGTGFNAAPVYNTDTGRYVPPAEAGHANLPLRTEADFRLARFIETTHGFPAVEEVLSGRGLSHVYAWLGHEVGDDRTADAAAVMAALKAGTDPRAREATEIFVRMLGMVAGNLTLETLPFGGVYLIGGVTRAITPYLAEMGFAAAFRDKGRFGPFLEQFSVSVVEDDYAALVGCAGHLDGLMH